MRPESDLPKARPESSFSVDAEGRDSDHWPVLPPPDSAEEGVKLLERLTAWSQLARGAYSPNTWRAWRNDWRDFSAFAASIQQPNLPATADTVRAFLLKRVEDGCAYASLVRYRSTIARLHQAAGLADPTHSETVRLTLKACARELGTRQDQARGLSWDEIRTYLDQPPTQLRDLRDRALVCLAYDGTLRPEDIVGVDVEHIQCDGDSPGTLLIPSSKTDAEGAGALVPVLPTTFGFLKVWVAAAAIESGAVFRRVVGHSQIGARLTTQSVTDIFKRVGRQSGLSDQECVGLSGHSARVGSAQDLFAANMEMPAVMQQGRWKDSRMPARYGERLLAQRGAMIKLATKQRR